MLLPNKIISIQDSCLQKSCFLIKKITNEITLMELYEKHKKQFLDISEFIETVELLFLTEKIDIDLETGYIRKC